MQEVQGLGRMLPSDQRLHRAERIDLRVDVAETAAVESYRQGHHACELRRRSTVPISSES